MSERGARIALWLGLLLMAPLPLHLLGAASIPVARMLLLACVCLGMAAIEGGGIAYWLALGFAGPALGYTLGLWVAAWLLARASRGLTPQTRGIGMGILWLLGASAALVLEPYRMPFGTVARGGLLSVLP